MNRVEVSTAWFALSIVGKSSIPTRSKCKGELYSVFPLRYGAALRLKRDKFNRVISTSTACFGFTRCPRWKFISRRAQSHPAAWVRLAFLLSHQQWPMLFLVPRESGSGACRLGSLGRLAKCLAGGKHASEHSSPEPVICIQRGTEAYHHGIAMRAHFIVRLAADR
jgi:hypothetical protein